VVAPNGSPDRTRSAFRLERVGVHRTGVPFAVTPEVASAYAAAVGATVGSVVPPLLSVVPAYRILFGAVDSVTPPSARRLVVHGDHEVVVHRPVRVGDELRAAGRVEAVRAASPGAAVVVGIDVSDAGDEVVATHRATALVRGVWPAEEAGPALAAPTPEPTAWSGTATVAVTADQPARYAEATGDHNAVHVDAAAARRAGFDDVIAHGLGVFGLVLTALVARLADGDPGVVRRARVRFGPPVRPGQALLVRWCDGSARVAFRAEDARGAMVLRSGELDLA
jgi:acyl dehydratase